MRYLWFVLLACNPLAVGGFLYQNNADPITWLNVAGVAIFGAFVRSWND